MMYQYTTHHYMDLYPEINFRTIESEERMKEFIEFMRTSFCSGTVSNAKLVSPKEYYEARCSEYWKGIYLDMLDNLDCHTDKVTKEDFEGYCWFY